MSTVLKAFFKIYKKILTAHYSNMKRIILFIVSFIFLTTAYGYNKAEAERLLPIYRVDRADNLISISFDCAWGDEYTDELLSVMDEYGVKSTFFTVEFWTKKYPERIKKISELGHEIGTHSKTHPHMSKMSKEQIRSELLSSKQAIEDITGKKVELFRAPFGEYDNEVISVASELSLYTVQWDVDSLDWKDLSAEEIAERIIKRVKSGSIILCHNNGLHTAESLPIIFKALKGKGFVFVPIGELIYKKNYKILPDGTEILD